MKYVGWILAAVLGIALIGTGLALNNDVTSLHSSQAQVTSLQGQLTAAQAQVTSTQQELTSAKAQLATAQDQVSDAENKDADDAKPEIHCTLGWGDPDPGTDMRHSATIFSQEDQGVDSSLNFVVTRKDGTTAALNAFVVPGHGSSDVEIPGWTFLPGDVLSMNEDGHRPGSWTVPAVNTSSN